MKTMPHDDKLKLQLRYKVQVIIDEDLSVCWLRRGGSIWNGGARVSGNLWFHIHFEQQLPTGAYNAIIPS